MAYDASKNSLMNYSSSGLEVWLGMLGADHGTPCDLNGVHTVNVVDVQLGIVQAIGSAACTNGDLDGDHVCNGNDVTRITDATGVCVTTP